MPETEWVDLVDLDNQVVGRAPRHQVRAQNLPHRGIGVLVKNSQGQVYVHQRTAHKDLFPSMYDMFVGGVVGSGEDYLEAARREVEEELGVESRELEFLFDHLYYGPQNFSWIRCYEVLWDGPIRHQPEEVQWGQWLDFDQLEEWTKKVPIVPDGLSVFAAYLEHRRQSSLDLNQFSAIIFDMDGILIDSEPFWRQAEIELFATVGVHLSQEQCVETMGLRIDEVVALRAPTQVHTPLAEAIVDRVIELVGLHGTPLTGVRPVLEALRQLKVPCALCTSSSRKLLEATLTKLQLSDFFRVTHSAEHEVYGKPHPACYLETARQLGLPPERCLAIEDSLNGVISAKAARMKVLAIPESQLQTDPRFGVADWRFRSLLQWLPQLLAATPTQRPAAERVHRS